METTYKVEVVIKGYGKTERECFDEVHGKLEHDPDIWEYGRIERRDKC